MGFSREAKVGLFVLLGLFTAGLIIFLIGDNARAFEEQVVLRTVFDDVQGLQSGSPVRMGGIHVGRVSKLAYSEDANDSRVHVELIVVASEAKRIRTDSTASVEAKGLLGDKMLTVTVGDPKNPQVPEGGLIPTRTAADLMSQISSLGASAHNVMNNLEVATDTLADEKFRNNISESAASLRSILESVNKGDGYASKLLNDEQEAQTLSSTISNLERASAKLDRALADVDDIVAQVKTGPGLAHELIYGEETAKTAQQFGAAAEELALTLRGIREGNGLAHDLLFGGGSNEQLTADLKSISADLAAITAGVRAGKGTVGALLVDPSIYEDLKMLLGNVQRNQTLRALVRYSIQRDQKAPSVEVVDPQAGSEQAGARVQGGDSAGK